MDKTKHHVLSENGESKQPRDISITCANGPNLEPGQHQRLLRTWVSFIAGVNAKWHSHFKTVWRFLTQLTILLKYNTDIVFWYFSKGVENLCPHKNLQQMFTAALSITAQTQKQPSVLQQVNRWTVVYAGSGILLSTERELKSHKKHRRSLNAYY